MGFGYLFLGYLFFFDLSSTGYTDVFGVLLMLLGLSTLRQYARRFDSAFKTAFPLLAVSAFAFLVAMLKLFDISFIPNELSVCVALLSHVLKCVFICTVLSGVMEIAKETDVPVLVARAMRNRLLAPILLLVSVPTEVLRSTDKLFVYFVIAKLVFGLFFTFLCAKCFFECYIWICLEGDENMEGERSRFGFINKLNELSARQDEKILQRKKEEQKQKAARKQGKGKKK